MALIKCPECEKEISDKAKSCPHCGYEINPQPTPDNQTDKKKTNNSGCGSWILIIGVIILILFIIGSLNDDSSNSNSLEQSASKTLAYSYAEDFVKKRLKSPSTAEFPGIFEQDNHTTDLGNKTYKILSWVDSQNGFGATIRTEFSCVIKFKGNEVTCTEFQFYE